MMKLNIVAAAILVSSASLSMAASDAVSTPSNIQSALTDQKSVDQGSQVAWCVFCMDGLPSQGQNGGYKSSPTTILKSSPTTILKSSPTTIL